MEQMVLSRCSTVSVLLKGMNLQMSQNSPAVIFFSFCSIYNKQITMKSRCCTAIYPPQLLCLRPKSKTNGILLLTSLGTGKNPAWIWLPVEARCYEVAILNGWRAELSNRKLFFPVEAIQDLGYLARLLDTEVNRQFVPKTILCKLLLSAR